LTEHIPKITTMPHF